ncbi:hypothetical protein B0H14DRAFT_2596962 [Mycena olivaceomarginata]|nr:hypothetical protein B0H14DRAFT_2596962 [Mycena olivaceomarginata]
MPTLLGMGGRCRNGGVHIGAEASAEAITEAGWGVCRRKATSRGSAWEAGREAGMARAAHNVTASGVNAGRAHKQRGRERVQWRACKRWGAAGEARGRVPSPYPVKVGPGAGPSSGGGSRKSAGGGGFDAGSEIRRWERGKLTTQWEECYRCAPRGWRRAQSRVAGAGAEKRAGAAGPMPRAKNSAESAESRWGMGRTPTPMSSKRGAGRRAERRRREPKKARGAAGSMPRAKYSPESAEKRAMRGEEGYPRAPRRLRQAQSRATRAGAEKARGGGGVDTEPPDQRQRPPEGSA